MGFYFLRKNLKITHHSTEKELWKELMNNGDLEIQKDIEWNTVKTFLHNGEIRFDKNQINFYPEEPADIFCKDINKKFQIVSADFGFQKLSHTAPKDKYGLRFIDMPTRSPQDVWKDFIVNPILKKNKYKKSAKGIVLLIDSYIEPPWIEKQLNIAKKVGLNLFFLKKSGFDEIYLVCPDKNIKVYP